MFVAGVGELGLGRLLGLMRNTLRITYIRISTNIQSNFNGSNTFGAVKVRANEG